MIIGLIGYARVGKDTVAEGLPEFKRYAFADELKEEVGDIMALQFGFRPNWSDAEEKEKYRDFLIFWGAFRRKHDPTYWIRKVNQKIFEAYRSAEEFGAAKIIITDVRYVNEVRWLRNLEGKPVYLARPGFGPVSDEEGRTIPEILEEYPRLITIANDGTKEKLIEQIRRTFCLVGS